MRFTFFLLVMCLVVPAWGGPLRDRVAEKTLSPEIKVIRDIAYGADALQKVDVYTTVKNKNAPIIVMVHGGSWRYGDKGLPGVALYKANYWVSRGFVFVSVNNRLLPTDPVEQAEDVSNAVRFITQQAAAWGGDGSRLILMGHSAGAHLVALVTARADNPNIRGAVFLDSGVLNVPEFMEVYRRPQLYDDAFGVDHVFWESASPYHRLKPGTAPFLIVCSTTRPDACPQGEAFKKKVESLGGKADLLKTEKSHRQVNVDLGKDENYTARVDAFIRGLGL